MFIWGGRAHRRREVGAFQGPSTALAALQQRLGTAEAQVAPRWGAPLCQKNLVVLPRPTGNCGSGRGGSCRTITRVILELLNFKTAFKPKLEVRRLLLKAVHADRPQALPRPLPRPQPPINTNGKERRVMVARQRARIHKFCAHAGCSSITILGMLLGADKPAPTPTTKPLGPGHERERRLL